MATVGATSFLPFEQRRRTRNVAGVVGAVPAEIESQRKVLGGYFAFAYGRCCYLIFLARGGTKKL